jgi:hypothetical protein
VDAPENGYSVAPEFEFVDGGNIKSRNDPHMDAVAITAATSHEEWSFYSDGKVTIARCSSFTAGEPRVSNNSRVSLWSSTNRALVDGLRFLPTRP